MGWIPEPGDPDAFHKSVPGEIAGLDVKETPIAGDLIVIEDGEDEYAKKYVDIDTLPFGSGGGSGGLAYAETIGDGSNTDYTVEHELDTEDLVVQLWDLTGSDPVEATADVDSITILDADSIEISFSAPPASDSYRVVIIASGGTPPSGGGFVSAATLVDTNSQASENTGDTDVSLTLPTGIAADDLMVIICVTRNSLPVGPNDSGWTMLFKRALTQTSSDGASAVAGNNDQIGAWFKTATTAQTTVNFTVDDDGTDGQVWLMAAFRDAVGVQDWSLRHQTDLIAASVLGTDGGVLMGFWMSGFESGSFGSVPSDMTQQETRTTSTSGVYGVLATKDLTLSGQTGAKQIAHTGMNEWLGYGLISIF